MYGKVSKGREAFSKQVSDINTIVTQFVREEDHEQGRYADEQALKRGTQRDVERGMKQVKKRV
jgi:hypothetical protein